MTRVCDLPRSTNLALVQLRVPDNVLEDFQRFTGGKQAMWVAGGMMGELWFSPDPPGTSRRTLYAFPRHDDYGGHDTADIEQWQVLIRMRQL